MKKKGINREVPKPLSPDEQRELNHMVLVNTHKALTLLAETAVAQITTEGAEQNVAKMRRDTMFYNIFNLAALCLADMIEASRRLEKKDAAAEKDPLPAEEGDVA